MTRDISRYLPEGAVGVWSERRSGKCVVCGQKFSKKYLIMRTPERKLVCIQDSRHISDEDVLLYTQPVNKWPRRRLLGLDGDVQIFDGKAISAHAAERPRRR